MKDNNVARRVTVGRFLSAGLAVLATVAVTTAVAVLAPVAPAAAATSGVPQVEDRAENQYTADILPTVQIDSGVVWAQAVSGSTVFAGGSFSNARPAGAAPGTNLMPRSNLLAYDIGTGTATNFAPDINGAVKSLAVSPDGKTLYVGGSFTKVNGEARFNIAAFDIATGALTNFKPAVGGSYVNAIVATSSAVYFGGLFSQVRAQGRTNLAAVNTSGALLAWAPTSNQQVDALVLAPAGDKLIAGGRFSAVNGASAQGTAALDLSSGAVLPWAASNIVQNGEGTSRSGIWSLSADDENVYGAAWAFYAEKDTAKIEGQFAATGSDGALVWQTACRGDSYGVFSDGATVYSTGHAHNCALMGGFPQKDPAPGNMRNAIAVTADAKGIQPTTNDAWFKKWNGTPTPAMVNWFPDWSTGTATGMGQAGWTITGTDDYLLVGGEFVAVNNQRQQGLVRFAKTPSSGATTAPRLSGDSWVPTAKSATSGTAQVTIPSNWDRDNLVLTYDLVDAEGAVLDSVDLSSPYWTSSMVSLTASGLAPGSAQTFTVVARDADGNATRSSPVNVTVSDIVVPAYVDAVLSDGPTTYWRLGGENGTVDLVGDNNAVTTSRVSPSSSSPLPGSAEGSLSFTGSQLSTASSSRTSPVGTSFATELWFSTTTNRGGKLLGYGSASTGSSGAYDRHVYMTNNGRLVFGVYPGTVKTIQSTDSYNDGEWHHLVAQQGTGGMELYVDGELVAQDSGVTSAESAIRFWRIGGDNLGGWPSRPSSDFFAGKLDEFAAYGATLTADQVMRHYALGSGLNAPTVDVQTSGEDLAWSFDASGSSANDGATIDEFAWDFGDGSVATGPSVTHEYAEPGTYEVTATVTDSRGLRSSASVTVEVTAPHAPPTAAFAFTATDLEVAFDASGSSADGAAEIAAYAWDFGDGNTSAEAAPRHVYAHVGTYDVTLRVTDDAGVVSDPVTHAVVVDAPAAVLSDDFERSVDVGWGNATVGGAWSATTGFTVVDGAGRATINAKQTRTTLLDGSVNASSRSSFILAFDRVADGTGFHANYLLSKSTTGEYRVKIRTYANGAVTIALAKTVGSAETIFSTRTLSGVTYTPGSVLRVAVESTLHGSSTDLAAKAWLTTATEPQTWTVSASDSEAGLQAGGRSGFSFYTSGTTTNGPVTVTIDDLLVERQ